MAYEMVMPYHLHMPSYFLETFTEYPYVVWAGSWACPYGGTFDGYFGFLKYPLIG